jgi:hypothetical protein
MDMKNRILILCVVLVVTCGSTALALDPMGQPATGLNQGQIDLGVEYSHSEQSLWRTQGYDADFTGVKQEINKYFVRLGYGISAKTEGFVRLGLSDYEYERDGWAPKWKGDDDAFTIGVGLKTTFSEDENIKWGGLAQVSWANYTGKRKNSNPAGSYQTGTFETEVYEFQLAAGPTYKLMDSVSVYGGPFMHIIDGDHYHKHAGGSREYDIEERSSFGVYVGSQIELSGNSALSIEYQRTNDAWAIAGGVKFSY